MNNVGELFPIFLVESAIYGSEWWDASFAKSQQSKRNSLRAAYDTLIQDGDKALFYVEGDKLLAPNTGVYLSVILHTLIFHINVHLYLIIYSLH